MVCGCVGQCKELDVGVYIFRYKAQERPQKVNYNLKIKGRGVSLVESGGKSIPKRSGKCEVPEVKKQRQKF